MNDSDQLCTTVEVDLNRGIKWLDLRTAKLASLKKVLQEYLCRVV